MLLLASIGRVRCYMSVKTVISVHKLLKRYERLVTYLIIPFVCDLFCKCKYWTCLSCREVWYLFTIYLS